jgi:hypothetical protein
MKLLPLKLAILVLLGGVLMSAERPSVGAIRWDGWFKGSLWEKFLQPKEWHSRHPFFAKKGSDGFIAIQENTQKVMDAEIGYAKAAGLDYWAFCYYHPSSWNEADNYNYGWKLLLSSKRKMDIRFCLLLQPNHLGPPEDWAKTADLFVSLMKEPNYQLTADGRPLVYMFSMDDLQKKFGSVPAARAAMDDLRKRAVTAGLKSPYLAAQVFDAPHGVRCIDELGFDAISAYTACQGDGHKEHTYAQLAAANLSWWNSCKATGKDVIPLVNSGWDGRPRLVDPTWAKYYKDGPWFAQPKPDEFAANVKACLTWVAENRTAVKSNCVLIYAWNEIDEGGWMMPTLAEGTAKLDALKKVLQR